MGRGFFYVRIRAHLPPVAKPGLVMQDNRKGNWKIGGAKWGAFFAVLLVYVVVKKLWLDAYFSDLASLHGAGYAASWDSGISGAAVLVAWLAGEGAKSLRQSRDSRRS